MGEAKMIKGKWNEALDGPISMDAIRLRHSPDRSRISENLYPAGAHFNFCVGQPYTLYVLKGSCTCESGAQSIVLEGGELVELERGDYVFEVLGGSDVRVIKAFNIPSNTA